MICLAVLKKRVLIFGNSYPYSRLGEEINFTYSYDKIPYTEAMSSEQLECEE